MEAQAKLRIADDGTRAMPRKINFTLKTLEALKVPPGKDRVWVYDSHTPRLAYMKTAAGASSFYWYGKYRGHPRRVRMENRQAGIDEARRWAAQKTVDVADGIDPMSERREARSELTFREVFQKYIETHAKPKKRTWQGDQKKYDFWLKPLGPRFICDITRDDIAELHAKIGKESPGSANRTLALISSVYSHSAPGYPNPTKGISRYPEHQRERFLDGEEIGRFMDAIKAENQDWSDFFSLLLFTGARAGNMKSMAWGEINLTLAKWTIPASKFKTNKPLTIALVPEAVEILTRRLKTCAKDEQGDPASPWVFPCDNSASGHVAEYRKAIERVIERAKLADFRVHDLRHTNASWQAAMGVSLPIIGKSLGHRSHATTQRYAHLTLDPVRASVGNAVAAMLKASKAKPKK